MWVWIGSSAEIVALDSFEVGDVVTWDCIDDGVWSIDLPPGIARESVLIEDADCAISGGEGVDVTGRVAEILVAHDQWHRDDEGSMVTMEGARGWSAADRTHGVKQVPPAGEASGYLVRLDPI